MDKINKFLFVDDERLPPSWGEWDIVRSFDEAVAYMNTNGCPVMISFDHDLGDGPTGYDLVKWIIEKDMDLHEGFIPSCFEFKVHSQNPIGAKNIQEYMNSYLWYRGFYD